MSITNIQFNNADPFAADEFSDEDLDDIKSKIDEDLNPFGSESTENNKIHIRIQQRKGKKSITTVQGLMGFTEIDFKNIIREMKKKFSCNGKFINNKEYGMIIQLQGDQRVDIREYLMTKYEYKANEIVIHGY